MSTCSRPPIAHRRQPIDAERLASVVEFAATQYPYTVLDVPRSDSTVIDSLDQASTIVVVANQELATVTNAGRMSSALRSRYRKAKVMTVINRTDRRSEIGHAGHRARRWRRDFVPGAERLSARAERHPQGAPTGARQPQRSRRLVQGARPTSWRVSNPSGRRSGQQG